MKACDPIESIDHRSSTMAARIHAVQMAAYRQEAALIETTHFPPLQGTVDDIRRSDATFFGAFVVDELAGVAQIESGDADGHTIASLVVAHALQRRGIARALLLHLVKLYGSQELRVQTAVLNLPAVNLYTRNGFCESRRWFVGPPTLELVALRRTPKSWVPSDMS